ncbi:MAG: phosphotransferase, partial [Chloroflexota bacterium]
MAGKSIDIENHAELLQYLRDTGKILAVDTVDAINLDGGVSNRTVWVKRQQQPDWILKQALEKLRVKVDWFSAPERIHREAAGLRWFGQIIPAHVPAFVFEDEIQHILAMTAVPQPHQNWKTMLLKGQVEEHHVQQFGTLLATIHNAIFAYPELIKAFDDRRFFEDLRLEPYYIYTAQQVPQAAKPLMQLVEATSQRQLALVHGDYSPKNVLVQDGNLYILDYEVIHSGDPAFDVGFSMTHLLSKAHFLPAHRSQFIEMAKTYWETYSTALDNRLLGDSFESYAVRHTLACL